jgi:putative endonuclease
LNWRYKKAEIDIIAKKGALLVFIEVKTRSYTFFGQPEDAIDTKKESFYIDAAQRYMEKIGHLWEIRFDIISVILDKNLKQQKLTHFKDAFFN